MSRLIKVGTPQEDNYRDVRSAASTWSQLKEELTDLGINVEGMKGVTRESRVTLEQNEAVLPVGAFTVVLFTKQMKSGNVDFAEAMGDLQYKINEAFNEIIEQLEEGAYGEQEAQVATPSRPLTQLEQDRAALAKEME